MESLQELSIKSMLCAHLSYITFQHFLKRVQLLHEKTNNLDFRSCPTQTVRYSHMLEILDIR